jgi:hypothetical protein
MPTPRPIIVATVGATSGTATRWPSRETRLSPQMRPKIATAIGTTIAVTVPKTRTRMSMATPMPMTSLMCASGLEILEPSWPPASTWTPLPSAGSAAVSRISSASSTDRSPSAVDGTMVA